MASFTISLHLLLSFMIVFMALMTAHVAFLPTYLSAVDAVDKAVLDLRDSLNYRAKSSIEEFLQTPLTQMENLYTTFSSGIVTGNSTTYTSMNQTSPHHDAVSAFSNRSAFEKMLVDIAWKNRDKFTAIWLYIRQGYERFPLWFYIDTGLDPAGQYPVVARHQANSHNITSLTVNIETQLVDPTTLATVPSVLDRVLPFSFDTRENDETTTFDTEYPGLANLSLPRSGYFGVVPLIDAPNLALICELKDQALETMGTLRVNLRFDAVQKVMQNLGLRKQSRGVAFISSPVRVVLGVSWDEPIYESSGSIFDTVTPIHERIKTKYFHNLTSGGFLTSDIVPVLAERNVLENPDVESYRTELDVRGVGKTFVDLTTVTKPGLRLKILLVMPESDFDEGITLARSAAIGGTAAALVLMIVFAIALGSFVTSPLVKIRERMELASRFADDGSQDDRSFLKEVALMQKSYERMRNGLNNAKPYLPQSVLQRATTSNDDDDDDDDEEIDGDDNESHTEGEPVSFESSSRAMSRAGSSHRTHTLTSPKLQRCSSNSSVSRSSNYSSTNPSDSATITTPTTGGGHNSLNISSSVAQKRVTVAVFNLRSLHRRCAGVPAELVNIQKTQLTIISKHITENRGTIDYFQGDHVQCSFNAVRPCAAHPKRAFVAALAIVDELSAIDEFPRVSVGISTGAALCGNMGTDDMRRFCIVGPVVQQANLLERLNKNYDKLTQILTLESIAADYEGEFVHRAVDIVQLPRPKSEAPLTIVEIVSQVGGRKTSSAHPHQKVEEEEWMYMLDATGKENPYSRCNQGFENLMEGEFSTARKSFERVLQELQEKSSPSSTSADGGVHNKKSLSSSGRDLSSQVNLSEMKRARLAQTSERGLEICRRFEENVEGAALHPTRGWLDTAFLKSTE